VTEVAFSPDGRTLATGGLDAAHRRLVRLWDVNNPEHPRETGSITGSSGQIAGLTFSPDGHTLATASITGAVGADTLAPTIDNEVALWDVTDPQRPRKLTTLAGSSAAPAIAAFSPVGHILATSGVAGANVAGSPADGNEIRLWNVSDPQHPESVATLTEATGAVIALAFRPDGRVLATTDLSYVHSATQLADGNEIRLWNVSDPQTSRTRHHIHWNQSLGAPVGGVQPR
jgi:WD40 repeat protein